MIMDQFRQHVRSFVFVDDALLAQLPKKEVAEIDPAGDPEVIIAGNTVAPNGGSLANYEMTIVADTVAHQGGDDDVALLATPSAGKEQNGRVGTRLRVIAENIFNGRGTSKGQRGGKGKKGRDGILMPPVEQPPFDPTGPTPPEVNPRHGENGGKGKKGGDGGPVELFLRFPSAFTAGWLGLGGGKGEGGDGGLGEPAANQNSLDGEPGLKGPEGDPGLDLPAAVRVGESAWRVALNGAGIVGRWARLRTDLAIHHFRRDNPAGALKELAAAAKVSAGQLPVISPLAPHLPALIRDHRAITGVARDQEIVPDVTHHAQRHADRAAALANALPDSGTIGTDPSGRLTAIRQALQAMLDPGGSFTTRDNELRGGVADAVDLLAALDKRTSRARNRLSTILTPGDQPAADPIVVVAGTSLSSPALADALVGVLGSKSPAVVPVPPNLPDIPPEDPTLPYGFQPSGDAATLLPADLNLLTPRSLRNRAETITDTELAALRGGAAGLSRLAEWSRVSTGQPGGDGQPVVVNLSGIAAELRTATGDPAVVDLLVELAELAHSWRLVRARVEQQLAGRETLQIHRVLATSAKTPVVDPATGLVAADLLPGVWCLLDDLRWYADRAGRASELLTFGLADPKPPVISDYPFPQNFFDGHTPGLAPVIYSPDYALDLRESGPHRIAPSIYDLVITAVRKEETGKPYQDYLKRGIAMTGQAPPYVLRRLTLVPEPTGEARPDLIRRFSESGEFWLDIDLAHLAGETGQSPHAEARVAGIKVALEFADFGPGAGVPLLVTHTGLSVQRDMSGKEHRQTLMPATVRVDLAATSDLRHEGSTMLVPLDPEEEPIRPIDFPPYGRGVAGGWHVSRAPGDISELPPVSAIEVEVFYEGIVPDGTASLRSVAFAAAGLRVAGEVPVTVTLTGPAGPAGVKVELASSDPATISLPPAVLVPAGKATASALATVLKPTGGLPPTLTARTADGVTRRARPVVPKPGRPVVSSVRLTTGAQIGHLPAVAVLPTGAKTPGRVLAALSLPQRADGEPFPPGRIHERKADLSAARHAPVGSGPRSLAFDPTRGRVYVANAAAPSVSVSMLDAATLKTLAETTVGAEVDLAVDPAAGLVYVSLFGAAKVLILSADDLTKVGEITDPTGQGRLRRPHGMAVFPGVGGASTLYVARTVRGIPNESEESSLTQIRRNPNGTHTLVRSLDLGEILTQPVDVAVDIVHQLVFVACLGGNDVPPQLVVLRHPTMTELGRVRLFSGGRAVASRSGSGLAYVAGEAGLTIVDGRSLAVAARFQLGDAHLDQGLPFSVAVDQVTGTAYVGTRDRAALFRIDAPLSGRQVFW